MHTVRVLPKGNHRYWAACMVALITTFMVAACGGGSTQPTANVTASPVPTFTPVPVATEAPVVEATATTVAVEAAPTEEATEEAVEEEATEEASTTANATATPEVVPSIFFLQPSDNAIIPLTSTVIMGVTGLEVQPAGEVVEGAGHFHLLIDTDFIPAGEVIVKDVQHLHFGNGQLETELVLNPGVHILRLQFADGAHIALDGDAYRSEIVVTARDDAAPQGVRFATPSNGAVVPPEFDVVMAATGLIVEPAGAVREHAGHMHLIVDGDFIEAGEVIPKDETRLHFGNGQLRTTLNLAPGEHILRLQMADGAHIALDGDAYRAEVMVTVAEDAKAQQVMFVEPVDGAVVASPFTVTWAASGLIIEPAGPARRGGAGHLHLLIDEEFAAAGEVIVKDETHLHFGNAQTTTQLELAPGEYILRLQMADGAHIALEGTIYQDEITITVE
jgi:hypothetical protein